MNASCRPGHGYINDEHQKQGLTDILGVFPGEGYTVSMINLILTLSLFNAQPAPKTAQFRPCVWPNTCKTAPAPVIAQFTTCVWPKTCGKKKSAPSLIAL